MKTTIITIALLVCAGCIIPTEFTDDDWTRLDTMMDAKANLTEADKAAIRAEIDAGTMSSAEIEEYKALLAEDLKKLAKAGGDRIPLPEDIKLPLYGVAGTLLGLWTNKKRKVLMKRMKDSPQGKILA